MKMTSKIACIASAVLLSATAAFADQKGYDIMKEVSDFKRPAFSHTAVKMILADKNGKGEEWGVEEYGKNENDLTSVVMIFKTGSKKGTRFLQIENEGTKPDDKFIYLPSLKQSRRVNSSEGSKSFLGTDATYDDLSSRDVDEDEHTYIKDEQKNGYDCYQIREDPKDKSSSQYDYRITWIDKKTMYPIYTEMYKKGKLVKTLTVNKIEKRTGVTGVSYDIPMSTTLKDMETGHSTTMQIGQIEIDKKLDARICTQNFLNTGK